MTCKATENAKSSCFNLLSRFWDLPLSSPLDLQIGSSMGCLPSPLLRVAGKRRKDGCCCVTWWRPALMEKKSAGLIVGFSCLRCCHLRLLELRWRWERLLAVLRRRKGWSPLLVVAAAVRARCWLRRRCCWPVGVASSCGEVQKPVSVCVAREGRSGAGGEQLG